MTIYNCAGYNLKVGGRAHRARQAEYLDRYTEKHDIDVWFLCEAVGYGPQLEALADTFQIVQRGSRFLDPDGDDGRWPHDDNCAILVRHGIPVSSPMFIRQDETWPRPRMSGIHPPRTSVSLLIGPDADQFRAFSGHRPPPQGRPEGKDQRAVAAAEWGVGVVRHVEAWPVDRVGLLWADWNGVAGEIRRGAPGWVAQQADLRTWGGNRIDFAMTRGDVVITDYVRDTQDKGFTDHGAVYRFKFDTRLEPLPSADMSKVLHSLWVAGAEFEKDPRYQTEANMVWSLRRHTRTLLS